MIARTRLSIRTSTAATRARAFALVALALSTAAAAGAASGCSGDAGDDIAVLDAGGGDATRSGDDGTDAGDHGADDASHGDGGATSPLDAGDAAPLSAFCQIEKARYDRCKPGRVCNVPVACPAQEATANAAVIAALTSCFPSTTCSDRDLDRCALALLADSGAPSAAQTSFATAYCNVCESGSSSCVARVLAADPDAGLWSAANAFVLEMNDATLAQLQQTCLGPDAGAFAADAGSGGPTCDDRFARCAINLLGSTSDVRCVADGG